MTYTLLNDDEEKSFEGDPLTESGVEPRDTSPLIGNLTRLSFHWIGHTLLFAALVASIATSGYRDLSHDPIPITASYIKPSEAFYDNLPTLAAPKSFWYSRGKHKDSQSELYRGPPDETNTKLWHALINVGFVSITKDEASRMAPKTARNILKPQEYVVTPQVFHDLHCVEMLRKFFWTAVNGTFVVNDAVRHVIPHYDHCFHMLRQSLSCYADLTPLTWRWHQSKLRYAVVWDSERQCRNWDGIMAWATERNTSGHLPTVKQDRNVVLQQLSDLERQGQPMPWDS